MLIGSNHTNQLFLTACHSHKKRKDAIRKIRNTGRIVDIFVWTPNFWSGLQYIKTAKNDSFNNFDAVLTTLCFYDYSAHASEAVEKIATD